MSSGEHGEAARPREDRRSPASPGGSAASSRAACTAIGWQIVGLDRRPFLGRPKDIEHHQVDLRSKKARDVFRAGDVDALIHLGVMHDPRARRPSSTRGTSRGTTKLLEYCADLRRAEGRAPLERERLRPAPRQPAVPHRGRAAARRRSASRRCAISSRSTCSRPTFFWKHARTSRP